MSDDLSDMGIHLQPKNVAETTYIRNAILKSLTASSESTLNKWFSYETEILEHIAVIFHLTAGPSFRSFQIGSLKYDTCSSFGRRNLFLITNPTRRQFALVKPKAKLKDGQAQTLLAFPEYITDPLAFYFCILRPVGTELSSSGSAAVPPELTKGINLYSAFIWGPRLRQTWKSKPPRSWKGPEIDAALMKHTFPAFKFRMTGGIGSQNTSSSIISSLQSGELKAYMSSLPFPANMAGIIGTCDAEFAVEETGSSVSSVSHNRVLYRCYQ
ncbi:hypothetical protein M378DRAFT_19388 [Amanita muscaria Koide BX008]|uniref:Uncharacterized protein n=1 Tax=Amanita muscaria (strain Koide BX008) TaxID=946122 RepID=A0A0C2WD10_AMAMK|nr:hypothetical protein M378DRAFT_19388 [Amanita muscaria Koide BX008]